MTSLEGTWQLLASGDWACAQGDGDALRVVTNALSKRLEPRLADLAWCIGAMAARDLVSASILWGRFADTLRTRAAELRT